MNSSIDRINLAVINYAEGAITLEIGQIVDNWEVTDITLHTVTFRQGKWTTSIQIPFVNSMGDLTLAGALAQADLINSAFQRD